MDIYGIAAKGKRFTVATSSGAMDVSTILSDLLAVTNLGANVVHVLSGNSGAAPTADNTCLPIPAGQTRIVRKASGHNRLYGIAITAACDVVVNPVG